MVDFFQACQDLSPGSTVLLRVDFNLSRDRKGEWILNKRLYCMLPVIKQLLAMQLGVILVSHLGRPRAGVWEERYSLSKDSDALNCLHQIKEEAYRMKKFILNNNKNGIMDSLNQSWIFKKQTSKNVINKFIEDRIKLGFEYGANAAKVSGAGGGGVILFMTEPNKGIKLRNRLLMESSETFFCGFNSKGVESWIIK